MKKFKLIITLGLVIASIFALSLSTSAISDNDNFAAASVIESQYLVDGPIAKNTPNTEMLLPAVDVPLLVKPIAPLPNNFVLMNQLSRQSLLASPLYNNEDLLRNAALIKAEAERTESAKTIKTNKVEKIEKEEKQEPTYEIEEYKARVVLTANLNIYKNPDGKSEKLKKIPEGTTVKVTAKSTKWGKVKYDGTTGWINLNYTAKGTSVNIPLIKQSTNYTCGSACSAMILQSHGKDVQEMDFWNRANRSGQGTFVYSIRNNLNYYFGENVYEYEDLPNSTDSYAKLIKESLNHGYPAMAALRLPSNDCEYGFDTNGHYVVIKAIYSVDGEYYLITNDSWKEQTVTITLESFVKYSQAHSGYLIYAPQN